MKLDPANEAVHIAFCSVDGGASRHATRTTTRLNPHCIVCRAEAHARVGWNAVWFSRGSFRDEDGVDLFPGWRPVCAAVAAEGGHWWQCHACPRCTDPPKRVAALLALRDYRVALGQLGLALVIRDAAKHVRALAAADRRASRRRADLARFDRRALKQARLLAQHRGRPGAQ